MEKTVVKQKREENSAEAAVDLVKNARDLLSKPHTIYII